MDWHLNNNNTNSQGFGKEQYLNPELLSIWYTVFLISAAISVNRKVLKKVVHDLIKPGPSLLRHAGGTAIDKSATNFNLKKDKSSHNKLLTVNQTHNTWHCHMANQSLQLSRLSSR